MIRSSVAIALALMMAGVSQPPDVVGNWQGTLKAGAIGLRIVLHVAKADDGSLKATMDSLDQGANGMVVTSMSLDASTLTFALTSIGGSFTGKVAADGASIEGTWTQGGQGLPLTLTRVKPGTSTGLRRPQNPVKPYPYREEEVSYDNKSAAITLGATLTTPTGSGPFPAVLLVTGSGAQDRDESLMGHRPFLVLADYLTRHGIAVLRADDRGVGKSTGTFAAATSADFATDAEAGIAYLQTRTEIDRRKIGIVGHSEGGLIAPMVAARNSSVAFIVLLAGSGVPGDEILAAQSALISEAGGLSHAQAAKNASDLLEVLALVKGAKDDASLDTSLRAKFAGTVPPAQINAQVRALTAPWFRYFIAYDPAQALSHVTCPVLALGGEKDLQVPPVQNLAAIRKALDAAGNKNATVEQMPGLNHLFQTARTGAPSEYGEIEETMSPAVLSKIAEWIARR
jgi:pimeloyl-ACP methyl ester carboxylesterase